MHADSRTVINLDPKHRGFRPIASRNEDIDSGQPIGKIGKHTINHQGKIGVSPSLIRIYKQIEDMTLRQQFCEMTYKFIVVFNSNKLMHLRIGKQRLIKALII